MRRFLIVPLSFAVLIACNSENKSAEEKKTETPPAASSDDITKNPDYQKGLALIGKSDCFTCHAINDKINGPAYSEVATKYAGAPDTIVSHLAKKIIEGGSGVWGEVPMTPHATLSQEDAEAMVKYVLLLKK
jgi:cytochrome c